jgi:glycosyltransferase involved in cell wall biosynthesis
VLQAQLPEIYQRADAFVLPSTQEPWGLVANEAMLCGLPVILSTQCGCTKDLLTPDTGWSFPPWDQSALTSLLEIVAATPRERLRQMGGMGRNLAKEYSPETCAEVVFKTVGVGLLA